MRAASLRLTWGSAYDRAAGGDASRLRKARKQGDHQAATDGGVARVVTVKGLEEGSRRHGSSVERGGGVRLAGNGGKKGKLGLPRQDPRGPRDLLQQEQQAGQVQRGSGQQALCVSATSTGLPTARSWTGVGGAGVQQNA